MDYFRKYLGTTAEGQAPSGAETIDKLCDRVQSSTLLEDRRDAVRALKSLSKKFRVDVGTRAMDILVNVMQSDRNDTEIMGYALETFVNITCGEPLDEELEMNADLPEDLGIQFTEVFIKNTDNVSLLLSLLEEYDFHVRWPAVKLLIQLLKNCPKEIQEIVLTNPMGVSKMMDLLSDSREIIRNDGILLLSFLVKGNTNIQKIVAFENAFERLLDIIMEEGGSDGGIIVEDCLQVLNNLLKNNQSNQNFFKEGSYIQRLTPFFELQPADENPYGGWSAQKVSNIHFMLQVVRHLVSPNNPSQQTTSCQKVMHSCELLEKLCYILMASGVPADVLSETINTVSEVIRGSQGNQEYFASVMAPSNPPRPVIVVLLMSMVNEKQPFTLRAAVLYCFQSFLYKNELGQSQIIQTLLPSTAEVNTISAGQLLCGGLFSADPLSTWLSAVALLHAVINNKAQKAELVRVQLATSLGNPPVSLLQQSVNILAQGGKVQTRVGILMLLCTWISDCENAIEHFLHHSSNVAFLISQVSSSEGDELELVVQGLCAFLLGICVLYNNEKVEANGKAHLRAIIEKRIGLERFTDKLTQVSKHELYSRAAKKPQLNYKEPQEVTFDYSFTQLFRKLENEVLKAVSASTDPDSPQITAARSQHHESEIKQYQDIIRQLDGQLNEVRQNNTLITNQLEELKNNETSLQQQVQQLKDQNSLLKASAKGSFSGVTGQADLSEISQLQQEMEKQKQDISAKSSEIEQLKQRLTIAEAKSLVTSVNNQDGDVVPNSAITQSKMDELNAEVSQLRHKIEQQDEEIIMYKGKYEDTAKQISSLQENNTGDTENGSSAAATNTALLIERNNLSIRVTELEKQLGQMQLQSANENQQVDDLQEKIIRLETDKIDLSKQVIELTSEKQGLDDEKMQLLEKSEVQSQEHEDALLLMAEVETKLAKYKQMLKDHGEKVSEDEDDDDDLGLDDDDDDDVELSD